MTAMSHQAFKPVTGGRLPAARGAAVACRASHEAQPSSRRELLQNAAGLAAALVLSSASPAAAVVPVAVEAGDEKVLCDAACAEELAGKARVATPSGLEYTDLKVGTGPSPPVGYQVVLNYVAMTPAGRVFDSSLDKGYPYDIRIGVGQVIKGLDEGVLSMKVGGIRRLYIPGELAFPKGLASAAGRPRVPPATPVVFDVQLLYIPGLSDPDEE